MENDKKEQVKKLNKVKDRIQSLLNEAELLIDKSLINDGDTSEESQRMQILNQLKQVEYSVNGIEFQDLK